MSRTRRLKSAAIGAASLLALALVACARIAGLEDSEDTLAGQGGDGGPTNGSSSSSGGTVTTPDGVTISPANIELNSPCGTPSDPVPLSINNTGAKAIDFEVRAPEGSIISLKDANGAPTLSRKGTVNPGQLAQVPISISSPTPTKVATELIVVAGATTKTVAVSALIKGSVLVISPPLIDFGEVRQNTVTPPQTIEISNSGNEPATITTWAGTGSVVDFKMSTGSITVAPGAKGSASVTFTTGNAGNEVMAEYLPTTLAAVCGTTKALSLKGHRIDTNVTVNPVTADFGAVDCGSSPNRQKTITVTNFSPADVAVVQMTLGKGTSSPFTLSKTMLSVPVAPSGGKSEMNFDVLLKQPVVGTPGGISDTVTVQITGPQTVTKTIAATANVEGALLVFAPAALNGYSTSSTTKSFVVRNVGNKQIALEHKSSNTGEFSIVNGTSQSQLLTFSPFNALNVDVQLQNASGGMHTANITTQRIQPLFFESGQLCQPPTVVTATANIQ